MDILQCQKMYVSFYLTQLFLILLGFIDSSVCNKSYRPFLQKKKKERNLQMPFCVYFQGVHGLLISLMNCMFRVIICIVQIIVSPFHYFFNTVTLSDLSFVIVLFFQQVFLDHLLYVSFCGRFRGNTALCPWSFVARDGRGNSPEAVLDGRGRQTVLLGYKERGLDH